MEQHKRANKGHHEKLGETMEEGEKLYILVRFNGTLVPCCLDKRPCISYHALEITEWALVSGL